MQAAGNSGKFTLGSAISIPAKAISGPERRRTLLITACNRFWGDFLEHTYVQANSHLAMKSKSVSGSILASHVWHSNGKRMGNPCSREAVHMGSSQN